MTLPVTKLDDLNESVKRAANRLYDESAARHGPNNRAVLLDRQDRQYQRFAELTRFIAMARAGSRLLDVGCGNAELYRFLASSGFRGQYVGVDINENLLAQARQRFEGIDVRNVDLLSSDVPGPFDYVVMSTIFNLDHGQTTAWIETFLERMWAHTSHLLYWNALTTHVTRRDPGFVYLDPSDMLRFCIERLSRRCTLVHHGVSYNYAVAVYRDADVLPCPG
jgi:SAM-dependent methyltransferase